MEFNVEDMGSCINYKIYKKLELLAIYRKEGFIELFNFDRRYLGKIPIDTDQSGQEIELSSMYFLNSDLYFSISNKITRKEFPLMNMIWKFTK